MKRQLIITILFSGQLLFSGCAVIGALMIAKNATCKIKINAKYIKTSCELINGVFFEKLSVIKKDSTGIPSEYIVTERFECYYSDTDKVDRRLPDKIYFNKVNEHFKWNVDTINIHFKIKGREREIISVDSVPGKTKIKFYNFFILDSKEYNTCPIKFKKDTWYYVHISDPRLAVIYLYIDRKNNYHVYKFDSGICPI